MAQSLTNLAQYVLEVQRKVQHTTEITEPEIESIVREAVRDYSKDVPRILVESFTGDGTAYSFTLASYLEGFTQALSVEYPGGEQDPSYLKDTKYFFYKDTTTTKLRLRDATPSSSETVIVTYTTTHSVTSTTSTVPEADEDAVANLAASRTCLHLAAGYLTHAKIRNEAEALGFASKAQEYQAQARRYWLLYKGHLGASSESDHPAFTAHTEFDQTLSWQDDRVFHPRSYR